MMFTSHFAPSRHRFALRRRMRLHSDDDWGLYHNWDAVSQIFKFSKDVRMVIYTRGTDARAWIHSARNEEAVRASGAKEVFIGDLNSREAAAQAMKGIDTVYFICNTANPNEDAIGTQLIEIAKDMGNVTFIYHSVLHSLLSDMPHHKKKLAVEKALVDSCLPYVIIQLAVFMQILTPAIHSIQNGGPFVQKFYVQLPADAFPRLQKAVSAPRILHRSGSLRHGSLQRLCRVLGCPCTKPFHDLPAIHGERAIGSVIHALMGGKLHTFAPVAFKQKTELAACQRLILHQTAGKHRFQIGRIVAQVRSGGPCCGFHRLLSGRHRR